MKRIIFLFLCVISFCVLPFPVYAEEATTQVTTAQVTTQATTQAVTTQASTQSDVITKDDFYKVSYLIFFVIATVVGVICGFILLRM